MPEYFWGNCPLPSLLSGRRRIALMLDFDGTLTPIRKDPSECFLSKRVKGYLRLISDSERTAVAVISGRTLNDLVKRIDMNTVWYGGNHGLDIEGPGFRYTHPSAEAALPFLAEAKRLLKRETAGIGGVWFEDKKYGFALHYRNADRNGAALVKRVFLHSVRENLSSALMVIMGKRVFELVPNVSWDKGSAALLILERMGKDCRPVYIGDDVTDESAFTALKGEGITIRVGRSAQTSADYYVKGYREIVKLMEILSRRAVIGR